MRTLSGIWRWRHNPLCRTTDLVESWVTLLAVVLIVVVAPVVGGVTGAAADDALRRTVQRQHQERHEVTARVVRALDPAPADPDPESSAVREAPTRVVAAWTAPDGSRRTGPTAAGPHDAHPGALFPLWTDASGRVAPRPLDAETAGTHAVLAGAGAAALFASLVAGGRRLVVWRLLRRRYDGWDRAWAGTGPDWGRTGTGS